MTGGLAQAELSRLVETDRLGPEGLKLTVEATPEERQALAGRFDLLAVDSLTAEVEVAGEPDGVSFRLQGRLRADVVQSCVVTLDPVPAHIEEAFERVYVPGRPVAAARGPLETWVDPSNEEPAEPLIEGRIDVGEAIAEELGLALDPYPRRPGASLPEDFGPDRRKGEDSPFAGLKRLLNRS